MDTTQVVQGIMTFSADYTVLFNMFAGIFVEPIGNWIHKHLPGDLDVQPEAYKVLLNFGIAWGLALGMSEPYTIFGLLAFASMGYATGKIASPIKKDIQSLKKETP